MHHNLLYVLQIRIYYYHFSWSLFRFWKKWKSPIFLVFVTYHFCFLFEPLFYLMKMQKRERRNNNKSNFWKPAAWKIDYTSKRNTISLPFLNELKTKKTDAFDQRFQQTNHSLIVIFSFKRFCLFFHSFFCILPKMHDVSFIKSDHAERLDFPLLILFLNVIPLKFWSLVLWL